jgi:Cyclic nucleotide-binding domain
METKIVKRGEVLVSAGHAGSVWRVTEGVFKLEKVEPQGLTLSQLALPGDLIGAESLCGEACAFTVTALSMGKLASQDIQGELSKFATLAKAYLQQQRRAIDTMKLREGPVKDRIGHFLTLFARNADGTHRDLDRSDLPALRELATILDSTCETVCRELKAYIPARLYQKSVREHWENRQDLLLSA